MMQGTLHHKSRKSARGGYILFEVVLALTVFAFSVIGLTGALNSGIETANILNKDNAIRIGMRSFLEEIRRKELNEMTAQVFDERLQVTFSSTVESKEIKDKNGTVLPNIYVLHVKAAYGEGTAAREESVDVYVYKTQTSEGS